jgi:hypothetical protein
MADEVTLRVQYDNRQVFSSVGKWLYPLFELEDFLNSGACPVEAILVEDKIVGKAAALLLVGMGIRKVKAGVLSELAKAVLERYDVRFSFTTIVERIECQTEILLADVEDPKQAYQIVKTRAGR